MALDKKLSHPASSMRTSPTPREPMPMAKSTSTGVRDTMTGVPKLAGHPAVAAAHKHNTNMSAQRFGTNTEKSKMQSDADCNYPGCGADDCPSY